MVGQQLGGSVVIVYRDQLRLADQINMVGTTAARPAASASNEGCLYLATDDDGGTLFRSNGSSWVQVAKGVSESGGGTNALLDGSVHTDTAAGAVARGDVIVGNSTPKWSRLAKGTSREALLSDGTDVGWAPVAPCEVWGFAGTTASTTSGLTSSFTDAPTIQVNTGFGTFRLGSGNSCLLPGGWLSQFSSLRHRFMVEAYRNSGSGTIEFELYDYTNSNQIATVTGINAASRTFYSTTSFSNIPSGDAMIALRARWQGSSSEYGLYGAAWHADIA